MSGSGRRGRRGGRRQRRREEQARLHATEPTNGQSASGHPALATAEPLAHPGSVSAAAADVEAAHPRPISARELVARLEAIRAHEVAVETAAEQTEAAATAAIEEEPDTTPAESAQAGPVEPRRFLARGAEWLAHVAGRGSGGTGRVAPARLEAIRFASASEPERTVLELIVPNLDLDKLYDDELAELLERGLRTRTGNE